MIERVFECRNAAQQPTIDVYSPNLTMPVNALVDSGSMCVSWIKEEKYLLKFGATKDENKKIMITSMNGNICLPIYRIDLAIGDIIFPNMPILLNPMLSDKNPGLSNVYIVLGAPIFRNMTYSINTNENKLVLNIPDNQTIRTFKIINEDGTSVMFAQ